MISLLIWWINTFIHKCNFVYYELYYC